MIKLMMAMNTSNLDNSKSTAPKAGGVAPLENPHSMARPASGTSPRPPRGFIPAAFLVFALWALITPQPQLHAAQPDDSLLIDRLSRDGMSELLDRLAQTLPAQDPTLRQLVQIGQARIRLNDRNLDPAQRQSAFDDLLRQTQSLIAQHPDDIRRSLWQTDLAQTILFSYLPNVEQLAAEFYEFGVPTPQQRHAFEKVVPIAFEQLCDADLRLFQLQSQLPLEPDHQEKHVATGLWDRMMKEYYKTKTQFYLALAAYYTTLLDDDQPYYKNLGANPLVPRQRKDPRQERSRLLDLTVEKLGPFVNSSSDDYGIRLLATGLIGRATLRLDADPAQAVEHLDQVIAAQPNDLNMVLAQLASGLAWHQKGQTPVALDKLSALLAQPLVRQNLLFQLLVTDQIHRLKLAQADSAPPAERLQAINRAYQPYQDLISQSGPAPGNQADAYKHYIFSRWRQQFGPQSDLSVVPDVVVAAIAEISRIEGQNLMIQSEELAQNNNPTRAQELAEQALPKLQQAVDFASQLLKRQQLAPQTKADAMFNLATARYFLAQGDLAAQLQACDVWTSLAQQHPDHPVAEQAIRFAIAVLQQLYEHSPRPEGVADAYQRAAAVLFDKFPTAKFADDQRLHYAFNVLIQGGRYQQALDILDKVPPDHPSYFEAQRESLLSLKALHDQAEKPADRQIWLQRTEQTAQALLRAADQTPATNTSAQNAKGWAKLILIDLAILANDTDSALKQLDQFDRHFADHPDLVSESLARGIMILTRVGKFEQAVAHAQQMMKSFPDSGAAVINGVLEGLDKQADQLRKQAQQEMVASEKTRLNDEALRMARAAEPLAEMLLSWARQHNYDDQQMLPFRLILAKARRLAENPQGAIELLKPLSDQFPHDPELLHNLGESYFAAGEKTPATPAGRQALIEAATRYFDPLIAGLEGQDDPRLRSLWWNAWLRRLQVSDILNEGTEEIALRVRQLEKTVDQNLGGEPYRSKLKELERKHFR